MKIKYSFLFIFLLVAIIGRSQSVLLDSLTLDTVAALTDLQEALKHPELVIKLELRRQHLKKFPLEILKFTNLQYLDLTKNNIDELPHEIGELKNLQYLSLSKNKLQDLPVEIGQLTNLFYLNLNQNEIGTLPNTIGYLVNLKTIDMWSNLIDKFPDEMANLKYLQFMDLRVIMIPDKEQARLKKLLPETKIEFSPYCKCQQ